MVIIIWISKIIAHLLLSEFYLCSLGYFLGSLLFQYLVYDSLNLDTWLSPNLNLTISPCSRAMHCTKRFVSFMFFKPEDFEHILHASYMSATYHELPDCLVMCRRRERRTSQGEIENCYEWTQASSTFSLFHDKYKAFLNYLLSIYKVHK